MSTQLPAHAAVIARPDVWMESEAIAQLARTAREVACLRAVGMPDLHPGRGIPVGAAFLFQAEVRPELVGSDAGCGVLLLAGKKQGPRGDALERRVRAALEEPVLPFVDPGALLSCAWHEGPAGLASLPDVPDDLAELARALPRDRGPSGVLPEGAAFAAQLGSVGGGNHFAEISRVDKIGDRGAAKALGLSLDAQVVLVHSGSRALGSTVAERYAGKVLNGDQIEPYLADLRGCVRYARANRLLIAYRLLRAAGLSNLGRIACHFDLVHNTVEPNGSGSFLHRKGAAPAERGQPTVVLGSRGAPSWVMNGMGETKGLCCVAHGAGRRMTRSEAVQKLRLKHTRASLTQSALGTRVLCDDAMLMYEEHPDAYKPIEPVIQSLEEFGAATRVAALMPLITVKK